MTIKNFSLPVLVALLGAFLCLAPSGAEAFNYPLFWHLPASGVAMGNRAGAGGIYGTGGRSDHGIRCSHCHIGGMGLLDTRIDATPAFFDRGGGDLGYEPGRRYAITVNMIGEHARATASSMDVNGFGLTVENASGRVVGRFISDAGQDSAACPSANPYPNAASYPAGRTTMMWGDCHGMLYLPFPRRTSWSFEWVAPAAGSGELTMFVALVDGDSDGESSLHDDTLERTYPLLEGR